jgi:hypothetical protein
MWLEAAACSSTLIPLLIADGPKKPAVFGALAEKGECQREECDSCFHRFPLMPNDGSTCDCSGTDPSRTAIDSELLGDVQRPVDVDR